MFQSRKVFLFSCLLSSFVLVLLLETASGCFITNCPPGGKRSGKEITVRQCESCGPPGAKGRCFGPSICCSQKFGCWFGTPETLTCQLENRFTTLCQNPGATCSGINGDMNGGRCAAENICCNSEMCTTDSTCHEESLVSGHHNKLDSLYQHLLEGPPRSTGRYRNSPSNDY